MSEIVDRRNLEIREFTDPYDRDSLVSVSIVYLPSGKANLDDILQGIDEAKAQLPEKNNVIVYYITDHRSYYNLGCSDAVQVIVLSVLGGAVSGITEAFIGSLLEWCKHHFKRNENNSAIDDPIEEAKRTVIGNFKPKGELNVVEILDSQIEAKIRISDDIYNYIIHKTKEPNKSIHIRKAKR